MNTRPGTPRSTATRRLAPIADLLKGEVYDLARWINANPWRGGFDGPPIPESTITKPPSPNCVRTRGIRTRCRTTTCSTRSWRGTWTARKTRGRSRPISCRVAPSKPTSARVVRLIDLNEYSVPRDRAEGAARRVRADAGDPSCSGTGRSTATDSAQDSSETR